MWTYTQIAQAIGWTTLIVCSPLLYRHVYKIANYLAYKVLPTDTILQYQHEGITVEAYYVRYRLFGKKTVRRLSDKELEALGADR